MPKKRKAFKTSVALRKLRAAAHELELQNKYLRILVDSAANDHHEMKIMLRDYVQISETLKDGQCGVREALRLREIREFVLRNIPLLNPSPNAATPAANPVRSNQ